MKFVLGQALDANGREGPRADVQECVDETRARVLEFRDDAPVEMQRSRGSGNALFGAGGGPDRLVTIAIARGLARSDVGRQRHLADLLEQGPKLAERAKVEGRRTRGDETQVRRLLGTQGLRVAERRDAAHDGFPDSALLAFPHEDDFVPPAGRASRVKTGGKDLGNVAHPKAVPQGAIFPRERGQVAESEVLEAGKPALRLAADDEQPRVTPFGGRRLGDELFGKLEGVVAKEVGKGGAHRPEIAMTGGASSSGSVRIDE